MFFSIDQIAKLLKTINLQHLLFVHTNVGKDVLSKDDLDLLRNSGFNVDEVPYVMTPIETQFKWGIISQAIGSIKSRKLSFKDFLRFLKEGRYLPLTPVEKYALDSVKRQAYKDIKGLGNKVSNDVNQIIIESDQSQRKEYEKIISQEAKKTIQERGTIRDLVSKLGHKTKDWSRDFGRISDYVMHQAFEEGRAQQIKKDHGDDAMVYKDVYPGACKHCVRLYLTDGIGSKPKLFKLSYLVANGTNIGRKSEDWRPIIGSTHPHCRCTIAFFDINYEWDSKSQSFNKPREFKRKVERKSIVTVTIGNTTIEV